MAFSIRKAGRRPPARNFGGLVKAFQSGKTQAGTGKEIHSRGHGRAHNQGARRNPEFFMIIVELGSGM